MSIGNGHHVPKTCLVYYRLVPLVGAVGHVSQTVTVDQEALALTVFGLNLDTHAAV